MIREKAKPRSLKRLFIWITAAIVLVLVWDRWNGALAVMSLCKADGGEHVFETTHAPGYLVDETRYFCLRCIESIGSGPFEYADALVEFVPGKRFPSNSYLRYSLGPKGDPDCEAWSSQANAEILLRKAGVRENECVRVNLLPEKPSGYALVNSRTKLTVRGATVALNEWRIERTDTAHVLARIRDYQFTSTWTSLLDMSGHGGNADQKCMDGRDYVTKLGSLPERVLRDPLKRSKN